MAETKYYAWSTFVAKRDDQGITRATIDPGAEVTADKLKLSKEEFQDLVDMGSIRTRPWPVPEGNLDQSPIEYLNAQAAALAETDTMASMEASSEAMLHLNPEYVASAEATAAAEKESAKT